MNSVPVRTREIFELNKHYRHEAVRYPLGHIVRLGGGIGECFREAEELYREMGEAGVLDNPVMMFDPMNESPGVRFRVGHAALTMAEYSATTCAATFLC